MHKFHVSLREKCPNTELLRNVGKYGPEKTPYMDIFHVVCNVFNAIAQII